MFKEKHFFALSVSHGPLWPLRLKSLKISVDLIYAKSETSQNFRVLCQGGS